MLSSKTLNIPKHMLRAIAFSLICSSALAGLDTPFENTDEGRKHSQDPNARDIEIRGDNEKLPNTPLKFQKPRTSMVYSWALSIPTLPVFTHYHPGHYHFPLTAALDPKAKLALPRAVQEILGRNSISSPEVNIVFQSSNTNSNNKLIFRPQYYFHPNTELSMKGGVSTMVDWAAIRHDGTSISETKPDSRTKLIQDKNKKGRFVSYSFHGPKDKIGGTRASWNQGAINVGAEEFSDFYTIAKDRKNPENAAVTLHWLLPQNLIETFREATDKSKTLRDIISTLKTVKYREIFGADRIKRFEDLVHGLPAPVYEVPTTPAPKSRVLPLVSLDVPAREKIATSFGEGDMERFKLLNPGVWGNLVRNPKIDLSTPSRELSRMRGLIKRDPRIVWYPEDESPNAPALVALERFSTKEREAIAEQFTYEDVAEFAALNHLIWKTMIERKGISPKSKGPKVNLAKGLIKRDSRVVWFPK